MIVYPLHAGTKSGDVDGDIDRDIDEDIDGDVDGDIDDHDHHNFHVLAQNDRNSVRLR